MRFFCWADDFVYFISVKIRAYSFLRSSSATASSSRRRASNSRFFFISSRRFLFSSRFLSSSSVSLRSCFGLSGFAAFLGALALDSSALRKSSRLCPYVAAPVSSASSSSSSSSSSKSSTSTGAASFPCLA